MHTQFQQIVNRLNTLDLFLFQLCKIIQPICSKIIRFNIFFSMNHLHHWSLLIDFCASRSEQSTSYLLFYLFYLFLQTLILLLSSLILLLQLCTINLASSAHFSFQEVNCIAGFFRLLIEFNEYFSELVDCSGLFEILLELFFLVFDSTLSRLKEVLGT